MQDTNDEIEVKELFRIISRYKKSIIFLTLSFFIMSLVYAYYKPNIYSSYSSLEIQKSSRQGVDSTDFMLKAFGAQNNNLDNNMGTIQSRFIVQKALETLDLTTRYYEINFLQKKTELYKDSPFVVSVSEIDDDMYYKNIELHPINKDTFRLLIKPISVYSKKGILSQLGIKKLEESDKISVDKVYKYGETINTAWFTITVNKIGTLNLSKYTFTFVYTDDLYDIFASGLSVQQHSEFASILDLYFEDTVSLRAQEITNAIVDTYLYEGLKRKAEGADSTLKFIDSQLDNITEKLNRSATDLEKYKFTHDVINLSGKASLDASKVSDYESEELQLQTEINILSNLQQFIEKNKDLEGMTIGAIKYADKNLVDLVLSLQKMKENKDLLLVDYTELHPEILKLTKTISSTKRAIKYTLKNNLQQLNQRNKDLKRMIKKYHKSLNSLPAQEKALAELARPLKVNQQVYQYLLEKKAETAILRASTIPSAKVIDHARDQYLPIKPKRMLIIAIGTILGLLIGITLAFIRNALITTIQNAEGIERITDLPIYGVIPLNKDKITKNIYNEAFKSIRTNLQFLPGDNQNQIISITSSVSGEGKTTIASTLAEMLARGDKRVILLDIDLRKASLHTVFNLRNDIGMSNLLTMQNSLEEVTKETNIYGLEMISAGPLPPNPSELILSKVFVNLLKTLREKYDYIVIDTPPAGLVTDATIIMNHSDITFAIVKANYSRKEFVENIDRLSKEHSDNRMGIILNGTEIGSGYGYGYGASYAYGYGNTQYYKDRG
ncbi:MAG: polysaccharide biosynthesis tyrosine autokinase [Sulfurimonas sp.]